MTSISIMSSMEYRNGNVGTAFPVPMLDCVNNLSYPDRPQAIMKDCVVERGNLEKNSR